MVSKLHMLSFYAGGSLGNTCYAWCSLGNICYPFMQGVQQVIHVILYAARSVGIHVILLCDGGK